MTSNDEGYANRVVDWLKVSSKARYATRRTLGRFSTSMRDFDDVGANLRSIKDSGAVEVTDSGQRLVDLRKAGLVKQKEWPGQTKEESEQTAVLSSLGEAVLAAWEKHGVAGSNQYDEFARHLLFALESRRLEAPAYVDSFKYWAELRGQFDALELINNWDALYALNCLDVIWDEFSPGERYRQSGVKLGEIKLQLLALAKEVGADEAVQGEAIRLQRSVESLIPRGRHQATFCAALEVVLSGGAALDSILDRFGWPVKPRLWEPLFTVAQKTLAREIVSQYADVLALGFSTGQPRAEHDASFEGAASGSGDDAFSMVSETLRVNAREHENPDETSVGVGNGVTSTGETEYKLPANIDFSAVLVEVPKLPRTTSPRDNLGKTSGPKKNDYQLQAAENAAIGRLGEQFAIAYEKWRLRERPELVAKIEHVSETDDSLGYDIRSFELDGSLRYVEVKGTSGPLESRFFVSKKEFLTAKELGEKYLILRVGRLLSAPVCCEIRAPLEGALGLSTYVYEATFKSYRDLG